MGDISVEAGGNSRLVLINSYIKNGWYRFHTHSIFTYLGFDIVVFSRYLLDLFLDDINTVALPYKVMEPVRRIKDDQMYIHVRC